MTAFPTTAADPARAAERPIDAVRGTAVRLPEECARLGGLEALLLDRFARAGYEPLRTPVLEYTELHERKSGAGIVARLFELGGAGSGQGAVCLRPELTAGVVRAYAAAEMPPELPWRVSHSGPVFRYETPRPGRLREFQQVGVERLGDSGPTADAEVIALADWALAEAGVTGARVRIGHVGLILDRLERSGLPAPLAAALVEMLSEAAAEGRGVDALEGGLEQLAGWLRAGEGPGPPRDPGPADGDDGGTDRLFRVLVPVVTGRRSGREIVGRLRRKWDLGHGLLAALDRARDQVHLLSEMKGEPAAVLDRLGGNEGALLAPGPAASLRDLLAALEPFGVGPDRVELDLGFGRGIGFYSQAVFEITADTPAGRVEVCGGGRYDGLARVLGSSRDDRGAGFAVGLERLAAVLDAQGKGPAPVPPRGFLVLAGEEGGAAAADAVRLAAALRAAGSRAVLETNMTVEAALDKAEAAGLARVVVVGAGAPVVHDLILMSETATDAAQLAALARDEARGS